MTVDINLLVEDLLALRHVPHEFKEVAKTQQVTLHMLPHEVPELIEGVRRGAESLRKESNRHLSEGRTDQAMRSARQVGVMEVLLDLLTHDKEEAA
jgi:hypothetical protein